MGNLAIIDVDSTAISLTPSSGDNSGMGSTGSYFNQTTGLLYLKADSTNTPIVSYDPFSKSLVLKYRDSNYSFVNEFRGSSKGNMPYDPINFKTNDDLIINCFKNSSDVKTGSGTGLGYCILDKSTLQPKSFYNKASFDVFGTMTQTFKLGTNVFKSNTTSEYCSLSYNDSLSDNSTEGKILLLTFDSSFEPNGFEEVSFTKRNNSSNTNIFYNNRKTSIGNTGESGRNYYNHGWCLDKDNDIVYYVSYQEKNTLTNGSDTNRVLALSKIDMATGVHDEEFNLLINSNVNTPAIGPIKGIIYDNGKIYIIYGSSGAGYLIIYDISSNTVDYNNRLDVSNSSFPGNGFANYYFDFLNRKLIFQNFQDTGGISYVSFFNIDDYSKQILDYTITIGNSANPPNNYNYIDDLDQLIHFTTSSNAYSQLIANSLTFEEQANIYEESVDNNISVSNNIIFQKLVTDSVSNEIGVDNFSTSLLQLKEIVMQNIGVEFNEINYNIIIEYVNQLIETEFYAASLSSKTILQIVNEIISVRNEVKNTTILNQLVSQVIGNLQYSVYIADNELLEVVHQLLNVSNSASYLDDLHKVFMVYINEIISVSNNSFNTISIKENVSEIINVNNFATNFKNHIVSVYNSINVENTYNLTSVYNEKVNQLIGSSFLISLNGEIYEAYCINLENNALTRYDNFNFNSYAKFNNNYYALGEKGLAILGGDLDDGEKVKSKIKTGYYNVANVQTKDNNLSSLRDKQKRLKAAYMIIKNDNSFVFRIYDDNNNAFDYNVNELYDNDKFKVNIGKNLKSSLFQFELETEGNFELKDCEVIPMILERRI